MSILENGCSGDVCMYVEWSSCWNQLVHFEDMLFRYEGGWFFTNYISSRLGLHVMTDAPFLPTSVAAPWVEIFFWPNRVGCKTLDTRHVRVSVQVSVRVYVSIFSLPSWVGHTQLYWYMFSSMDCWLCGCDATERKYKSCGTIPGGGVNGDMTLLE